MPARARSGPGVWSDLLWGHAGFAFLHRLLVKFSDRGFNGLTGVILLSAGAWRELDLLARRREQLGLERPQPIAVRTLLIRGTLIGGVFPLLVLVSCLVLLIQDRLLARQQEQLTPDAERYDIVEKGLTDMVVQMDALTTRNRSIAAAMADVRSSSALLGELTQLLPSEMTLDKFQIEGSRLSVDGTVLEPNGLRTINAFLLRLAQSSLFDPQLVRLEKAEVSPNAGNAAVLMRFSLNAGFRGDAAAATRPRLAALGAFGLATRVRFLEAEQLLQ